MFTFRRFLARTFLCFAVTALCLSAAEMDAQLRQLSQISFGPKQPTWTLLDLDGKFEQQALALTSTGDLLTLSPRRNGVWELFRVRGWSHEKPAVDHLQLPGYFSSHDQHDLENLEVNIYVTPDGSFAVCVGTAEWMKRVNGWRAGNARTVSSITVIDLASFNVARSTQMKTVDPFEFQSVEIDAAGRIVVSRSSFVNKSRKELVNLDVPSLRPSEKCAFSLTYDDKNRAQYTPITMDECNRVLHSMSLEDYLKVSPPNASKSSGFTCNDSKAEYCPQPDSFTPDMRFGLGMRTEGHDNLLGSWVQTRATAILFSTERHAEIGEIDMTRNPAYLRLTAVDGQDYLLSIRAGSELTVYQLFDTDRQR
jgi:hypothetical protein